MLEKQRHQLILEILEDSTFAKVTELCEQLQSSEATIRRDLVKLSRANKVKKIRGGAEVIENQFVPNFKLTGNAVWVDTQINTKTKKSIAQAAVQMCTNGDSIIINGGSSTFMMSEYLRDMRLNILTNSFMLAQELLANSLNQVTVPGGEIYRKQSIILSSFENDTTQHFNGSKMFMGCPGISEIGVMESDPLLILAEQKLRKRAEKLIILADSTKIGITGSLMFTPISDVDTVITDSDADINIINKFRDSGVKVIVVDSCD